MARVRPDEAGPGPALPPTRSNWERLLVRRGVALWLGARVLLLLASTGRVSPTSPTLASSLGVVCVVALLAYADLRLRREEILLANLGVSALRAVLYCSLAPTVIEALLVALFS